MFKVNNKNTIINDINDVNTKLHQQKILDVFFSGGNTYDEIRERMQ